MGLRDTIAVIKRAQAEMRHERLDRAQIEAHQRRELQTLLDHAARHSPFYRDRLAGRRTSVSLAELPAMHKRDLVRDFESIVTDPRLTLATLQSHAREMRETDPLLFGEYRILTTGGTSGQTTYVPFDRSSWLSVRAAYVRVPTMHGFGPRLPRLRIAQVTAGGPLHMTNRLASTHRSPAYPALRLDVTAPIGELTSRLNEFRPDLLSGYPSIIAALADEQQAGRLSIRPKGIFCGSEQLTSRMRQRISETWVNPYDIYATTESGGVLGFECSAHEGLHVREEQAILEPVDDQDQPVAEGETATGLLLTSWLNKTLPLIRYRLDDAAVITSAPCRCGRTSPRIIQLAGRQEDTVILNGQHGPVPVHPNHFEETIEERPEVAQYQVLSQGDQITIAIVARPTTSNGWTQELTASLESQLRHLGAQPPPIKIELVQQLSRTASPTGKLKTVHARGAQAAPQALGVEAGE